MSNATTTQNHATVAEQLRANIGGALNRAATLYGTGGAGSRKRDALAKMAMDQLLRAERTAARLQELAEASA